MHRHAFAPALLIVFSSILGLTSPNAFGFGKKPQIVDVQPMNASGVLDTSGGTAWQGLAPRCKPSQYSNYCVLSKEPLHSQSDNKLLQVVTNLVGPPVKIDRKTGKVTVIDHDPGWCYPTSSTNVFSGELLEVPNLSTKPSTVFLDNLEWAGSDWQTLLVKLGLRIKKSAIEFRAGGVDGLSEGRPALPGLISLITNAKGRGRVLLMDGKGGTDGNGGNNGLDANGNSLNMTKEISRLFAQMKPGLVLGFMTAEYNSTTNSIGIGGHALSLNGVDGNYLRIFDPWGRIYWVSLTKVQVSNMLFNGTFWKVGLPDNASFIALKKDTPSSDNPKQDYSFGYSPYDDGKTKNSDGTVFKVGSNGFVGDQPTDVYLWGGEGIYAY